MASTISGNARERAQAAAPTVIFLNMPKNDLNDVFPQTPQLQIIRFIRLRYYRACDQQKRYYAALANDVRRRGGIRLRIKGIRREQSQRSYRISALPGGSASHWIAWDTYAHHCKTNLIVNKVDDEMPGRRVLRGIEEIMRLHLVNQHDVARRACTGTS